jgi:hypothetical protein
MTTTYSSLFRRPKLDGILATFTKAAKQLDDFLDAANSDLAGLDAEASRISAERAAINHDIARAGRAKAKLVELVA